MDKKLALITLLENSLMIPDASKLKIIARLNKLPPAQIDALGKLLVQERQYMIDHKDTIIKQTKLLLDTLELAIE